MSTIRDFFEISAAFQAGVAPITEHYHDFNRAFASMDPAAARVLRRKFRKLWRSLARRASKNGAIHPRFGTEGKSPTRAQLNARKLMVKVEITKRASTAAKEAGAKL